MAAESALGLDFEITVLDLEVTRRGRLHRLGALRPSTGQVFERLGGFDLDSDLASALEDLDAFCAPPDRLSGRPYALLGHNLLEHDLKTLEGLAPRLRLLRLPVIDTLLLSPLAFPQNPYHHLVKDYRLVRDSVSDPVADCRLAWRVFRDQAAVLRSQAEPELLRFYAHCFASLEGDRGGLRRALAALAGGEPSGEGEAAGFVAASLAGSACAWAVDQLLDELRAGCPPDLAYAVAWLRVSGGDSVLPPWVRYRFPDLPRLLDRLRQPSCESLGGAREDCSYCRAGRGARDELRRLFGFEDFRAEPRAEDGSSLQRSAVLCGLRRQPHLAVLATGAGKSLCYQLPALVHYLRRGQLTVVISPLQALMKDQVENLNRRTGTEHSAALYGLLSPPERGQLLERLLLGSIGLLYIAPEQLRNPSFEKVLAHREIAAWVFDEAHCLSKWGHDFRPDYLYAARFIRSLAEKQKRPAPPVACYTATAKREVVEEIREHFRESLGQDLEFFGSSAERRELVFQVEAVAPQEKLPRIARLLEEHLESGCAVVYFGSRRATLRAAAALQQAGVEAEAFHGGLEVPEKRRVLEAFAAGEVRAVCATNAFGMGIDKDDVRLVVHADIPGSLESYLQEAGRAGRDRRRSLCVLLYDDGDVERQFQRVAGARLTQRDLAQLLRGVRRAVDRAEGAPRRSRAAPGGERRAVVTSGELVRDEGVDVAMKPDGWDVETRVRSAIAWLEKAGFVRRLHNRTRVFEGRLRVSDLQAARAKIDALPRDRRPADAERARWLAMLRALFNAEPGGGGGVTVDALAELPAMEWSDAERPRAGSLVLRGLTAMAEAGLLSEGLQLSVLLQLAGRGSARTALGRVLQLERAILEELEAADPDVGLGEWRELSLRLLNQRLIDRGLESRPHQVLRLLRSLSEDGKGLAGQRGSVELRFRSRDRYALCLLRDWRALGELASRRQQVASVVLAAFIARASPGARGRDRLDLPLEELIAALRADLALGQMLRDPLAAAERGVLFLHEQEVLHLQSGLAVFRQAMTLELTPEAKGRRYSRRDYRPLEDHYGERTFQVHAMARYAEIGLEALHEALRLVQDYFTDRRSSFAARWFEDQAALERATGSRSYERIVESLGNPSQAELVTAPQDRNLLVLAGPGAGKTRVVVHRCAYLLRVERVPARGLLVLCFNRNASLELRRRLRLLVGEDARGVTVCTYHGLAMRLLGRSFATDSAVFDERELQNVIPQAVELLGPDDEAEGAESAGERLAGYSHLLVDEYQDIDSPQYQLVARVAGRRRREGQLAILAVGDDDQTIYGWSGARVEFIRRFREDYGAREHYLVQCYRSTRHILDAAHAVIESLPDRLKEGRPIEVDAARRADPPGGAWAARDPEGGGRVRVFEAPEPSAQALEIAAWLLELRRLDPALEWRRCAVLARRRDALSAVRCALEAAEIPATRTLGRQGLPSLPRIREIRVLLEHLRERDHRPVEPLVLARQTEERPGWWAAVARDLLEEWLQEFGEGPCEARALAEFLYESLAERRRAPALGSGVLLSTVHAAKGLEFDHVALADGGWGRAGSERDAHEQSRLYYVGMTRARRTLALGALQSGPPNPHLERLGGLALDRRAPERPAGLQTVGVDHDSRVENLGREDHNRSYAGRHPPGAPVHRALAALTTGDRVRLRRAGERLAVETAGGQRVAMLSARGSDKFGPRLGSIAEARVLALAERRLEDNEPAYRDALRRERWEVPVLEVVLGS
ncbi:MAG: RecQ family ATP-dependent DNA helicase [Acidobacteriota bacterium]